MRPARHEDRARQRPRPADAVRPDRRCGAGAAARARAPRRNRSPASLADGCPAGRSALSSNRSFTAAALTAAARRRRPAPLKAGNARPAASGWLKRAVQPQALAQHIQSSSIAARSPLPRKPTRGWIWLSFALGWAAAHCRPPWSELGRQRSRTPGCQPATPRSVAPSAWSRPHRHWFEVTTSKSQTFWPSATICCS